MTKCCRDPIHTKSSVYNQTGQSYVDQLALHRSMCIHLKRVLSAKSTLDSNNARFLRNLEQRSASAAAAASPGPRLRFLERAADQQQLLSAPGTVIDKLAYDTEHHPLDILEHSAGLAKSCASRSHLQTSGRSRSAGRRKCDPNCPHSRPSGIPARVAQHQRGSYTCCCSNCWINPTGSNDRRARSIKNPPSIDFQSCPICSSFRTKSALQRVKGYHGQFSHEIHGDERVEEHRGNDRSQESFRSSHDESLSAGRSSNVVTPSCDPRLLATKMARHPAAEIEEACYAKFVYDITQEIVQNHLYNDGQLKRVFQKHLDDYSDILDKKKMLYEIYQLKISLNILDDSDDEDEEESRSIFAQKFATSSQPKPPTPPKVLDENKLGEKLDSYKRLLLHESRPVLVHHSRTTRDSQSNNRSKNVQLVDANPRVLLTERDVLGALLETDVDPTKIEGIHKRLFDKHRFGDISSLQEFEESCRTLFDLEKRQRNSASSPYLYKEKLSHGILRKDSPLDFTKKLSREIAYQRSVCLSTKAPVRESVLQPQHQTSNEATRQNLRPTTAKPEIRHSTPKRIAPTIEKLPQQHQRVTPPKVLHQGPNKSGNLSEQSRRSKSNENLSHNKQQQRQRQPDRDSAEPDRSWKVKKALSSINDGLPITGAAATSTSSSKPSDENSRDSLVVADGEPRDSTLTDEKHDVSIKEDLEANTEEPVDSETEVTSTGKDIASENGNSNALTDSQSKEERAEEEKELSSVQEENESGNDYETDGEVKNSSDNGDDDRKDDSKSVSSINDDQYSDDFSIASDNSGGDDDDDDDNAEESQAKEKF